MFGKLRVWDTEHNNGVLIYLLLAERAIEIVADRGLSQRVDPREWQRIVERMGAAFRDGRFEDGLTQALEEVSALLVEHFPLAQGEANPNELPDRAGAGLKRIKPPRLHEGVLRCGRPQVRRGPLASSS